MFGYADILWYLPHIIELKFKLSNVEQSIENIRSARSLQLQREKLVLAVGYSVNETDALNDQEEGRYGRPD